MSEEEALHKSNDKAGGRWLRDQGLQLLVLLASMLTATCYLVGRAGLLGWYEAAGVPVLVFSWPVQDVVIRGFVDSETWLLVASTFLGAAFYLILVEFTSRFVLWLVKRWRGAYAPHKLFEKSKQGWRRTCNAIRACVGMALIPSPSDKEEQGQTSVGKGGTPLPTTVIGSILMVPVIMFFGACYIAGALLLFDRPYRSEARTFKLQYLAATGRLPPAREEPSSGHEEQSAKQKDIDPLLIAEGKKKLADHAFVKVVTAGEDQSHCGWLMQANGGQVLLLTAEGLVMKNFGGGAYEWRISTPGSCVLLNRVNPSLEERERLKDTKTLSALP